MDDNNAPDTLAHAFHDFISGDSFVQGMKDAWAKHFGSAPADAHQQAMDAMNKQANDATVQNANKSFIKPDAAAAIRKKAMQK